MLRSLSSIILVLLIAGCAPPAEEPAAAPPAPRRVAVDDQPAGSYVRYRDDSGNLAYGRMEGDYVFELSGAPWTEAPRPDAPSRWRRWNSSPPPSPAR